MEQGRQEIDLPPIVLIRLAGKAEQNIPGYRHSVVTTPLEANDVLHGRHALVHRFQLRETEAFQPGLHALHAPHGQRPDLALLQIALGFDKHIQIAVLGGKPAEQILDIFHIDDVVHQPEPCRIVATRQIRHLASDLFRRLGAEFHTLRIQPAEGAMVLLTPPATA